jgi:hypothetical protein
LLHRDVVKIGITTVAQKRTQSAHGTVEPHAGISLALNVEVHCLGASCQPSQVDRRHSTQRRKIDLGIDSDGLKASMPEQVTDLLERRALP